MPQGDFNDEVYRLEREISKEVAIIKAEIAVLRNTVDVIKNGLDGLITRPEFTPVKLLAYGMAGSMLAGVIAALLSSVIK